MQLVSRTFVSIDELEIVISGTSHDAVGVPQTLFVVSDCDVYLKFSIARLISRLQLEG